MRKKAEIKLDRAGLESYASRLLGVRALSRTQLRDRLLRRAQVPDEVEEIVAKMEEYGAVNDQRLAEMYTNLRKDQDGIGKGRVLQDLRKRRVSGEVAAEAVSKAYADTDEAKMIEAWLERKYRTKNMPVWLSEQKNMASTFRRLRTAGFSAGKSLDVLRRISKTPLDVELDDDEAAHED